MRHAFLHLELEGLINGVGYGQVSLGGATKLRVRLHEVAGLNGSTTDPAAGRGDDPGIGVRYVGAQRVDQGRVGGFLLHPGP